MRKRDQIRVLLGRSPRITAVPEAVPVPTLQTLGGAGSAPASSTHTVDETTKSQTKNHALEMAIARHLDALPELEKGAFREASKSLTSGNILLHVQECDAAHREQSHFRSQAENLSRFLGVLDRFMAGVTIGLQSNPDISAIVVGGVRLVIDVAISFVTFFNKLSDMLCRFGDSLAYLAEYAKIPVQEELVLETLANVYGFLLQFCKQAYRVFTNQGLPRKLTSWRTFWRIQWIPFEQEFGRIESDMRHHLDVLRQSAHAVGLNATLDLSRREKARSEKQRSAERESFLNWISSIPFEKIHEDIYAKKHPGTGDWLLQTTQFRNWFDSTGSALIWCYGTPGAGKSVLASNVLEYITTYRALERDVGICFAYYSYQSPEMQDSSQIIPALIKQLCRKSDNLPPGFLRMKLDSFSPSSLGNWESFNTVAQDFKELFLVMDGLDECPREKRHHVLKFISAVVDSLPHAKIFVTSRRETDLIQSFEQMSTPTIQVEARNVAVDISNYVTDEIKRLRDGYDGKKLYLKSKILEQKIVEALTTKAEGMFLWVDLQIANLCRVSESHQDSEVEKALNRLPSGLDATYIRALDQINAQPDFMRTLAFKCFAWVLYAVRPLSIRELRHALATRELLTDSDDVKPISFDVVQGACAGLLFRTDGYTLYGDEVWNSVRPIHYSVKEFLTNPSEHVLRNTIMPNLNDAFHVHTQLAITCLSYLQSCILQGPCSNSRALEDRMESSPFAWYAACSFDLHISSSGEISDELRRQTSTFLSREDWFLAAVLQLRAVNPFSYSYPHVGHPRGDLNTYHLLATVSDIIYGTEVCKVPGILDQWKGLKPFIYALHQACSAGSVGAVAQLLTDGCDVNERDSTGVPPLYYAAKRGDLQVLKILVESGADTDMKGGEYGTALQAAAKEGDERSVQLLLSHNANVNARGGFFGNALAAASFGGYTDIVELLIAKGADVNIQGKNALHQASASGHPDIVELLLAKGADVNIQGKNGETALHHASFSGRQNVVELLLAKGAGVNIQDKNGKTALYQASFSGHPDIVELLLAKGADVNVQDKDGETALYQASHTGHSDIVELLLAKGANLDAQSQFGTALHIASMARDHSTVELLLAKGADVQVRWRGKTALQVISADVSVPTFAHPDHKDVIELLLSHGATYDEEDSKGAEPDEANHPGADDINDSPADASDRPRASTASASETT